LGDLGEGGGSADIFLWFVPYDLRHVYIAFDVAERGYGRGIHEGFSGAVSEIFVCFADAAGNERCKLVAKGMAGDCEFNKYVDIFKPGDTVVGAYFDGGVSTCDIVCFFVYVGRAVFLDVRAGVGAGGNGVVGAFPRHSARVA